MQTTSHIQVAAIETLLTHYPNLKTLLFDKDLTRLALPMEKVEQTISGMAKNEKILVHLALDIWDELSTVSTTEITTTLDRKNYHCYIESLDLLRGTRYAKIYEEYLRGTK